MSDLKLIIKCQQLKKAETSPKNQRMKAHPLASSKSRLRSTS